MTALLLAWINAQHLAAPPLACLGPFSRPPHARHAPGHALAPAPDQQTTDWDNPGPAPAHQVAKGLRAFVTPAPDRIAASDAVPSLQRQHAQYMLRRAHGPAFKQKRQAHVLHQMGPPKCDAVPAAIATVNRCTRFLAAF